MASPFNANGNFRPVPSSRDRWLRENHSAGRIEAYTNLISIQPLSRLTLLG